MSKKLKIFPEIYKKPPTKRELIAASEYAKAPARIAELASRLSFIREEKADTVKEVRHVRK